MEFPIRILQRPSNNQADNSDENPAPALPVKTREQREAEYAAARLRIMGAEKPEDDKPEPALGSALVKLPTAQASTNISKANVTGTCNGTSVTNTVVLANSQISSNPAGKKPASTNGIKVNNSSNGLHHSGSSPSMTTKHLLSVSTQQQQKQQQPPCLMSIKTSPVGLDCLGGFSARGQPLLTTPQSAVQPQQTKNCKQSNGRNTHAVVNVAQTLQLQQKQQGVSQQMRQARHSDTNLYLRQFARLQTANVGLQQPQNHHSLNGQQQMALVQQYAAMLQNQSSVQWGASFQPQPGHAQSLLNGVIPTLPFTGYQQNPNSAMIAMAAAAAVTADSNANLGSERHSQHLVTEGSPAALVAAAAANAALPRRYTNPSYY